MPEVVGYTWRHWVMSADRIAALRARAAAAAAAARERESARAGAQAGVGGGAPASQAGGAGGGAPDLAEEARLRLHWEHKVQEVCAAFKFPSKVMVCAVTYFKVRPRTARALMKSAQARGGARAAGLGREAGRLRPRTNARTADSRACVPPSAST